LPEAVESLKSILLKPGREKSVLRCHPWIFSGAVAKVEGDPQPGETVTVLQSDHSPLALAAYSPRSSILARIWTWDVQEEIGIRFFKNKLRIAINVRKENHSFQNSSNACRLVFAESDGLPGLVVDQYDNWLVLQLQTVGVEHWKNELVTSLREITGCENIYERSDLDVRRLEGLPERVGVLSGQQAPEQVEINENGLRFLVDVKNGQKTGFFLDQRENRRLVQQFAAGKKVLNCFCYTGGFSLNAARAGAAEVVSIDSSADALALAQKNASLNGCRLDQMTWLEADVFQQLRRFRDEGRSFDLIVLDPPKFAPTIQHAARAARAYKDINLLAFKLLRPGGVLFTFSCSGGITMELFQKIVADAALDAGVTARILQKMHQASDHPVALNFPESEYLKGLVCQV
jgi:23S rRNA (cytosine1962-C5)-methyltransferase